MSRAWVQPRQSADRHSYQPDLIKGDLDSLRPDVRAFYETLGVPVIRDRDQNSTDLGKCIATLPDFERRNGLPTPVRRQRPIFAALIERGSIASSCSAV